MRSIRQDLKITDRSDEPGCVLFDPRSGEAFKFGVVEQYLIELLSRPHRVEEVARNCSERFDGVYTAEDVVEFLELLDSWGLLETSEVRGTSDDKAEPGVAATEKTDAVAADQVIEMRRPNRWHLGNPERFFDALNQELGFLRHVVWIIPIVFALGLISVFKHWDEFSVDLSQAIARFGLLGRLVFAAFTVNLATQILKGVVARNFGLATPSLGLLMLFGLIPRFNIQIVPRGLPSRRARLWLTSVSTWLRLFLFGLTTILWAATRTSGSSLPTIALELALLSMISLIFVGNPLWKGDGANFLAAWIEVPQLQQRSRRAMKSFFFLQPEVILRHSRHRVALGIFGLASTAFFLAFVSLIVFVVFTGLERRYQGAGVALFLALACYVGFMARRQYKAGRQRASFQGQPMHNRKQTGPTAAATKASNSSPAKSAGRVFRLRLKWVLLFVLLACLFLPYRYETGGEAEILPFAKVSVTVEWDSLIEEVYYEGGEWVEAGDKLARLAWHRQERDLEVTRGSMAAKQHEIDRYLSTPMPEEVELAKARQTTAELRYKYSLAEMQRLETVYEQGAVTLQSLEDARRDADIHRQELAEAEISLQATIAQVNPNLIEELRAEVSTLESEAHYFEEQLRRTYVTSPIRGRIVTQDLKFLLRSYLEAGQLFAEIEDTSSVFARVAIPEADIDDVKPGARVRLKLWAYPNNEFEGVVDEINPATEEAEHGRIVYITSYLENADGRLKSGLSGYGKVEGKETILLLAFSRALTRFILIEVWSWLP